MEQRPELTISKTIFFLALLLIIQSILVVLLMSIYGLFYVILNPEVNSSELINIISTSNFLNVIIFLFIEISFLLFALILGRKYRNDVRSLVLIEKVDIWMILIIFLFSMSFLIVSSELENIFASIFGRMTAFGGFIMNISKGPGILGLIIAILVIDIIPAISEETLFRGIFLKNLSQRYGVLKALVITSFLFALMHINLSVIISIFLLGLMLGYIYLKTKNLIYPVMLHFFYNAFATLYLRLNVFKIKGLTTDLSKIEHVPVIIFIPSVIFSILLALIIYKTIESRINDKLVNDVTSSDF